VDLRRLRLARLPEATVFHTSYVRVRWPALFNTSGAGRTRFSPLWVDGVLVPTMYGAVTQTVALLETAFHDVHEMGTRIISESLHLAPRGLVALTAPVSLPLIDLTDEGLARVGLSRAQMVATTAAHYACTRRWAVALHRRRIGRATPVGLLWQSRVAELARGESLLLGDLLTVASDVFLLFGDRVPTEPGRWSPGDPHYPDLASGDGRLLAELIAEQLGAVIVPS
jgi:hypothetical protein